LSCSRKNQAAGALSGDLEMKTKSVLLAVLIVASGCAARADLSPHDVLSHRDPTDPARETSGDQYHSVVSGYHPRSVVEPRPWSETATEAEKPEGNAQ
jgi:hypothetical protein